jgi:hypothetical protein
MPATASAPDPKMSRETGSGTTVAGVIVVERSIVQNWQALPFGRPLRR